MPISRARLRARIIKGRAELALGRLLCRLRVPSVLREFDETIDLGANKYHVRTIIAPTSTMIKVNEITISLNRYTGKVNGCRVGLLRARD